MIEHKLICRKCSGPHLTIYCGKTIINTNNNNNNNTNNNNTNTNNNNTNNNNNNTNNYNNNNNNNNYNNNYNNNNNNNNNWSKTHKGDIYNNNNKYHNIKTFTVKMSNLPEDITEEELIILTNDWGHISKIKVLNFNENSIAYINFIHKDESEYFIKALDKTPFEYQILSINKV